MIRPIPGTPSKHLPDDAIIALQIVSFTSNLIAPNVLMASISNRHPDPATTAAISSIGFKIPEVVSQWTTTTSVI